MSTDLLIRVYPHEMTCPAKLVFSQLVEATECLDMIETEWREWTVEDLDSGVITKKTRRSLCDWMHGSSSSKWLKYNIEGEVKELGLSLQIVVDDIRHDAASDSFLEGCARVFVDRDVDFMVDRHASSETQLQFAKRRQWLETLFGKVGRCSFARTAKLFSDTGLPLPLNARWSYFSNRESIVADIVALARAWKMGLPAYFPPIPPLSNTTSRGSKFVFDERRTDQELETLWGRLAANSEVFDRVLQVDVDSALAMAVLPIQYADGGIFVRGINDSIEGFVDSLYLDILDVANLRLNGVDRPKAMCSQLPSIEARAVLPAEVRVDSAADVNAALSLLDAHKTLHYQQSFMSGWKFFAGGSRGSVSETGEPSADVLGDGAITDDVVSEHDTDAFHDGFVSARQLFFRRLSEIASLARGGIKGGRTNTVRHDV